MSDDSLVTTEAGKPEWKRVLIPGRHTPARTGRYFQRHANYQDLQHILPAVARSEFVAVDFETRGGDYSEGLSIVGLGLAWDSGSCYLDWGSLYAGSQSQVRTALLSHKGLLAHNVYFDGGVMRTCWGQHGQWAACTFSLYKMLANEGWPGQRHGLKEAMVDVLQWENANEDELEYWLITNGWYRGTRLKDASPAKLDLLAREKKLSADKGQLWRAPAQILGQYCVLDAEACYLLYTEHLMPVLAERFTDTGFSKWFTESWMHSIRVHIDQKIHGICVDRIGLLDRQQHLGDQIEDLSVEIRTHEEVAPHIATIETELLSELLAKEPEQYLRQKPVPPEPPRYRKNGSISKVWQRWQENLSKYQTRTLSKNWENWHGRLLRAREGKDPAYRMNFQSDHHLRRLFYELMGKPVRTYTDAGLPGTGVKALKNLGPVGQLLIERSWAEKELGYITDYIERSEARGTIHPSFRMPGTKTGRLSSSGPNMQQIPKSMAVMSLFVARPGRLFVDLDFSALEPVVATEFSGDENMRRIYADGAPPNDIYLYVAAHIPGMAEEIRATGYDPKAPTAETLAKAKKECKKTRSIAKTVVLACQYGAGVKKILETLETDNVFLPEEEVAKIHSGYWKLFSGVREFRFDLERQWKRNGGYLLNGLGRPMCVTEDYKHDCLNRFIQSTGHDILVEYIRILTNNLDAAGLDWDPLVIDWHDAAAVEVAEDQLERTVEVYKDSLDDLNRHLGGSITLKGTPSWGRTMASIKEPEE
jgi:DNA polymerase I-like protein with 3'-5' exonuclease and polymerase domains